MTRRSTANPTRAGLPCDRRRWFAAGRGTFQPGAK